MFLNPGAADTAVLSCGEELVIYEVPGDETTKQRIRAEVRSVDSTDFLLLRAGLRPNVDLVANVTSTTEAEAGQRVQYDGAEYRLLRVETLRDPAGHVQSRRLLLVALSPGGHDLG